MVSSSVPRLTVNAAIIIPKAVVSAVFGASFDGVMDTSLVLLSDGEGSSVDASGCEPSDISLCSDVSDGYVISAVRDSVKLRGS